MGHDRIPNPVARLALHSIPAIAFVSYIVTRTIEYSANKGSPEAHYLIPEIPAAALFIWGIVSLLSWGAWLASGLLHASGD